MSASKLTREQVFARLVADLEVTFAERAPLRRGRSIFINRWVARSKRRYPGSMGTGKTKYLALEDLLTDIARALWWVQPRKATPGEQRRTDALLAALNAPPTKRKRGRP